MEALPQGASSAHIPIKEKPADSRFGYSDSSPEDHSPPTEPVVPSTSSPEHTSPASSVEDDDADMVAEFNFNSSIVQSALDHGADEEGVQFKFDNQNSLFTPSEQKYFSEFLDQLAGDDPAAFASNPPSEHPTSSFGHFNYDLPSAPGFSSPLFRMTPSDFPATPESFDDKVLLNSHLTSASTAPHLTASPTVSSPVYLPPQQQQFGFNAGQQSSPRVSLPAATASPALRTPQAQGRGVAKATEVSKSRGQKPSAANIAAIAASNMSAASSPTAPVIEPTITLQNLPKHKPSLARGATAKPLKIEEDDSISDDDGSPQSGRGGQRELLTEEEKRMNHIMSEKKRRNNIRLAFKTMTDIIPSLQGTNFSKATILNKANEYLVYLKERNTALTNEVQRLKELLERREPGQAPPSMPAQQSTPTVAGSATSNPPEISWSRAPTFTDEMKIFVIWACFLTAMVDPMSSQPAVGSQGPTMSRSLLSHQLDASSWIPLGWALIRTVCFLFATYLTMTFDHIVKPNSQAYQSARLMRMEGEKQVFFRRERYFLKALEYLGCPLPGTDIGLFVSLVWQVSRQLLHLIWIGRYVERALAHHRGVEPSFMELASNFHSLAHQYISADSVPLKAWVSLLRALNLAECAAENDPLLAEIYSSISFQIQFHLPDIWILKSLAKHYRQLADQTRAAADCSTKTLGYVVLHDSFAKMASGQLKEAAAGLKNVGRLFLECGRLRSAWEVFIFQGVASFLRGELRECQNVAAEIRELHQDTPIETSTSEKQDVVQSVRLSQLLWSKMLHTATLLHDDNLPAALASLTELQSMSKNIRYDETKWSESGHLQQLMLHAFSTFALYRQGKMVDALAEAEEAAKLLSNVSSHTFFAVSYIAQKFISDTIFNLWLGNADSALEPRISRCAYTISQHLRRFARSFPFAQPRALLSAGLYACLLNVGKDNAAFQRGMTQLAKAKAEAHKLDMPLDEALALYCHARFCTPMDGDQMKDSASTLHKLGAHYQASEMELYIHSQFVKRF